MSRYQIKKDKYFQIFIIACIKLFDSTTCQMFIIYITTLKLSSQISLHPEMCHITDAL